ncbi:MAG: S-adenosylmethionine decarboxylase [Myxococcota bacterium]|nr:S-adenosylmethionine decarboxylase [Myxococcota bacterium]
MFEYNGKHVLVDAAALNHDALVDLSVGQRCLTDIVESIGMTMVLPPVGVQFPHATSEMHRVLQALKDEGLGHSATARDLQTQLDDRANEYYGYSTFAMIAESHLSLHTFPEGGFLTFDIYSCRDFEHDGALAVLDAAFQFGDKQHIQVIDRRFDAPLRPRTAGAARMHLRQLKAQTASNE